MPVRSISVSEALARYSEFDAVLDARSPAEYALDHLPGAQNWAVLDDAERREVGTEYKQVSAFEARKHGAAMVARRIADLLDAHTADKPRQWQPLVYCWRGGQRSGSLAWFLDQVGFRVNLLQGGYKAFRAAVRQALEQRPGELSFVVIGGRTGSGKSRLLQALAAQGAQVLDLEALACHRGSILGRLPHLPQPSQKHFEMQVWRALHGFDAARVVYVESESRKIGALQVPEALILRMRSHGRMVMVDMPTPARVALLLQDYAHFAQDPEGFCGLIAGLAELRGHDCVDRWQGLARSGQWASVYEELMRVHYDPLYGKSMAQNYSGLQDALALELEDGNEKTLREAAQGLIGRYG